MCKRRCERIPKVGKLPAPSRHRSPALSQTVRGSRRNPISVSRWSKICPIVQRRQHVCKRPCVTGYRRSENCPSPSCHHPESDATCAPVRVATSRVDPPTTCWPTGALAPCHTERSRNPRLKNCLRRHTIVLRHSRRVCAGAGTLPPLFLDGPKSTTTTHATFACRSQLRSHIRNGTPLFSGWATLSTPATGASTDAGRHALGPEHTPFREHRLRCVRCTCMRP